MYAACFVARVETSLLTATVKFVELFTRLRATQFISSRAITIVFNAASNSYKFARQKKSVSDFC